jgi:hypothetical protein
MLIYFTGDTDTPASLARQFAGYDHDELAQWIYYANVQTQAHQLIPGMSRDILNGPLIKDCDILNGPPLRQADWSTLIR